MTLERGDVAKIIISVMLFLFLVFVSVQIYIYSGKLKAARVSYEAAEAKLATTETDHDKLEKDYAYYLDPVNLVKELKARFNYREAGEKSLILVPQQ